ncbi:hypothetical protein BT69DRAFT_1322748 [Atractiella rhizophila]|nr:hypothetical protein BT69DRAFT_1322748 [Atractiella rhizophila]
MRKLRRNTNDRENQQNIDGYWSSRMDREVGIDDKYLRTPLASTKKKRLPSPEVWKQMRDASPGVWDRAFPKAPCHAMDALGHGKKRIYDLTLSASHCSLSWILTRRKGMLLPELEEQTYDWEIIVMSDIHSRGQDERVAPDEVLEDLDSGWRLKVYVTSPQQRARQRMHTNTANLATLAMEVDRFQLLPTPMLEDGKAQMLRSLSTSDLRAPIPVPSPSTTPPKVTQLFPSSPARFTLPTPPSTSPLPSLKDQMEYAAPHIMHSVLASRRLSRHVSAGQRLELTEEERDAFEKERKSVKEFAQENLLGYRARAAAGGSGEKERLILTREDKGAVWNFVYDQFPDWIRRR